MQIFLIEIYWYYHWIYFLFIYTNNRYIFLIVQIYYTAVWALFRLCKSHCSSCLSKKSKNSICNDEDPQFISERWDWIVQMWSEGFIILVDNLEEVLWWLQLNSKHRTKINSKYIGLLNWNFRETVQSGQLMKKDISNRCALRNITAIPATCHIASFSLLRVSPAASTLDAL